MEKKLCLSRGHKVFAGVCGGLAEYFGVDVTLIRIIWAIVAVMFVLTPIIFYIICWAVMPMPE